MNCTKCSKKYNKTAAFCPNCGEKAQTATNAESKVFKFEKFKLGAKQFWIAGSIALLLLATALFVFLPKTVNLAIQIATPNGGVFNTDCSLSPYLNGEFTNELTAVVHGDSDSEVISSPVEFITRDGGCQAISKITVDPNTLYDLSLGTSLVGSIKPGESWSGNLAYEAVLKLDRTLKLKVVYNAAAGRCKGPGGAYGWTCWDLMGIDWDDTSCFGTDADDDIKVGQTVAIKGMSSKITTKESLPNNALVTLVNSKNASLKCTFPIISVKVPNDDSGYEIQIGERKPINISNADLSKKFWLKEIQVDSITTFNNFD